MKKLFICTVVFVLTMAVGCGNKDETANKNTIRNDQRKKQVAEKVDNEMQIMIQGEQNETIIFVLNDSTAAKSLYDQLPITIAVENYGDNEKIFYPSQQLDVSDTPLAKGPAGTLAYYEPWGDVVMYYGESDGASGLYALGETLSGEEFISQLHGTIEVTKYSIKNEQENKAMKQDTNTEAIASEDMGVHQSDGMHHIQMTVGTESFTVSLYDNDTVRELMNRLPFTLGMNELHGNEKYYYFSERLPTSAQNVSQIHTGDLKLFGADCLVLFYKDFSTSYAYTSLGQVNNPQGLAMALGSDYISIRFDRIN